jgi:DNA repair exonuclease SbcCD ATPase subunit
MNQLENQRKEYENSKQTTKNNIKEEFLVYKDELTTQYDLIFEEIKKQNTDELEITKNILSDKKKAITNLRIQKSEVKNTRLYEIEIENCTTEIENFKFDIFKRENYIQQANERIKNLNKEWELEEIRIKENVQGKIEKQNAKQTQLRNEIDTINLKIENSKDSFYGWLNENVPEWGKTIGKVIDEENVLFKSGLNPQRNFKSDFNLYGVGIDLTEIPKTVKTIADYQKEKIDFENHILTIQRNISDSNIFLNDELDKIKKRFQPKVRDLKDTILTNQFYINQNKEKLDEYNIRLIELKKKAESDKKIALDKIEALIEKSSEEELFASAELSKVEGNIKKQIDVKKKEKDNKIKSEQENVRERVEKIDFEIIEKNAELSNKISAIKIKQKKELDQKGADTEQIETIDSKLSTIDNDLKFIEANISIVERYKYDKEQLFDKLDEFKSKKALFEKQLDTEHTKHKILKSKLSEEISILNDEIESIEHRIIEIEKDLKSFDTFKIAEGYATIESIISAFSNEDKTGKSCTQLIDEFNQTYYNIISRFTDLQESINKFIGNFQENNIFSFKTKFNEKEEYFEFAELLKEFIDENKISEYKKRVEERFAHIIKQIGKETGELVSKEGEIHSVITDINKDFIARNFVGAIKSMELRTVDSANRIVQLLIQIKTFNDANAIELGKPNLFTSDDQPIKNEKAISLLKQLIKEMATYKEKEITLSDSFELQFRIVENDNDTDWVEKLSNVGSDGTDVLVKAMINIMLLNVFKDRAAKKHKDNFRLHCMMDEIGKLHPTNVKGILKFANERNILLINCSPTTYNATDYRYTYLLSKDSKNVTMVKRLVKKIPKIESEIISDEL